MNLILTRPKEDVETRALENQLRLIHMRVEDTMNEVGAEKMYFQDKRYNSILKYYPKDVGSFTFQLMLDASSTDTVEANTFMPNARADQAIVHWLQSLILEKRKVGKSV